ncbi:MAG: hypothetical protein JRN15_16700 [Nitrososphaerota archaeon]|nr:hypothetical protein [Nitrososphaerota archaeon]
MIAQNCKNLDPAVVVQQYFPYRTASEVAEKLGISVDAAKHSLYRLMKRGRVKTYPLPGNRTRFYFGSSALPEITLEDTMTMAVQAIALKS